MKIPTGFRLITKVVCRSAACMTCVDGPNLARALESYPAVVKIVPTVAETVTPLSVYINLLL